MPINRSQWVLILCAGRECTYPLHAELLEKRSSSYLLRTHERIRIKQRPANNRNINNTKPPPQHLRQIPHRRTTSHSAQIRHDLRDRNRVGGELVFVFQQRGVQVLRAVRHEVEPGHEEDEVDEQQPVAFEGYAAFGEEGGAYVCVGGADALAFEEGVRFA